MATSEMRIQSSSMGAWLQQLISWVWLCRYDEKAMALLLACSVMSDSLNGACDKYLWLSTTVTSEGLASQFMIDDPAHDDDS